MKSLPFLAAACALICAHPAFASERRVLRIDSLLASRKGGVILLQAKGAVPSGGWNRARLHVMHGDGRTITVEFLATTPPPGMTVIERGGAGDRFRRCQGPRLLGACAGGRKRNDQPDPALMLLILWPIASLLEAICKLT